MVFIDLEQDFDLNHKALNGFAEGFQLRYKYQLPEHDKTNETITFIFPHYIWNISSTFFKGLFQDSYRVLGKDTFTKRYKFDSESHLTGILNSCVAELEAFMTRPVAIEEDKADDWKW